VDVLVKGSSVFLRKFIHIYQLHGVIPEDFNYSHRHANFKSHLGKDVFIRPRKRTADNIKIDLRETDGSSVEIPVSGITVFYFHP
jgi:uncharacterized linocin/CFP29 family protein